MLIIEHEHIVLLLILTMISFNCIALNGFFYIKEVLLLNMVVHCKAGPHIGSEYITPAGE
jgi:hypothetical protein